MSDITSLSARQLSSAIQQREVSCEEVMVAYLFRIDVINPQVNAIVALRPRDELINEAKRADLQEHRGWLHGIPFAIKDLVKTSGIASTDGSPIFINSIPRKDDMLAARIKAAGAIIVGKTNTPEFGLGSHSYNPVYGVTRNPYNLNKSAGGSSGGAGSAISARLLAVADGSDMMGSLRNPAAWNNIYGFRPSYGVVPNDPEGELYLHQLATNGPMARDINDLATLLDTLAQPEPRLPHANLKHVKFADAPIKPATNKRIAWIANWNGYYPTDPEILTLCEKGLKVFAETGSTIEAATPSFNPALIWESWKTLRSWNIASSLKDLYTNAKTRTLLKPEAIWEIETGLALSIADIQTASEIRSQWFVCMAELLERFDAAVMPSSQVFPFDADIDWPTIVRGQTMKTYHQWMEIVIPVSLIGLPSLNVPVGFNENGLPAGMQLVGRRGADLEILELGEAYHQATGWPNKSAPQF